MPIARHAMGGSKSRFARPSKLTEAGSSPVPSRRHGASRNESGNRRDAGGPADGPTLPSKFSNGFCSGLQAQFVLSSNWNRLMMPSQDVLSDPVLEVLTEYEEKLRTLHQNDRLAEEAQRTFGALVNELERRSGLDRRRKPRVGGER